MRHPPTRLHTHTYTHTHVSKATFTEDLRLQGYDTSMIFCHPSGFPLSSLPSTPALLHMPSCLNYSSSSPFIMQSSWEPLWFILWNSHTQTQQEAPGLLHLAEPTFLREGWVGHSNRFIILGISTVFKVVSLRVGERFFFLSFLSTVVSPVSFSYASKSRTQSFFLRTLMLKEFRSMIPRLKRPSVRTQETFQSKLINLPKKFVL